MVGVAGRSKGCATCRRRKVKCDLTQPLCQRCEQASLRCEGYERFPVFIVRTTAGVQRRLRLEETKPRDVSQLSQQRQHAGDRGQWPVAVISSISSRSVEATRYIGWFWQTFIRRPPVQPNPTYWLEHIRDLHSMRPALQETLLAVAVARCGQANGDTALIVEGRRLYTRCLGLLQCDLFRPRVALHDDTITVAALMILYELIDPTDKTPDGWLRHIHGVTPLLRLRGAYRHRTERSRAVLEHCRTLLMIKSLLMRQASLLSEEVWLTIPWKDEAKTVEQQVYDFGLQLGSLFEQADKLEAGAGRIPTIVELVKCCAAVQCGVQCLEQSHLAFSSPHMVREDFIRSPALLRVHLTPAELMLHITALAIELGAIATALELMQELPPRTGLSPPNIQRMADRRPTLALEIVHSTSAYLHTQVGASIGAARLVFALRLARQSLDPQCAEFGDCESLLESIGGDEWTFGTVVIPALPSSSGHGL